MFKRFVLKELQVLPNLRSFPNLLAASSTTTVISLGTTSGNTGLDGSIQGLGLDPERKPLRKKSKTDSTQEAKPKATNSTASSISEKSTDKAKVKQKSKVIEIATNIANHDLQIKIKAVMKILKKGQSVDVKVNGSQEEAKREEIQKQVESALLSESKVVERNVKQSSIRFKFRPLSQDELSQMKNPKS